MYGRVLLMTSEYCPIGSAKNCNKPCIKGRYVLKDRMGFEFPLYTDTNNCNTSIYNSKTTSIESKNLDIEWIRIDILDESIEEINNILEVHGKGGRIEGENYTGGNRKSSWYISATKSGCVYKIEGSSSLIILPSSTLVWFVSLLKEE